jgi:hypothetical protein
MLPENEKKSESALPFKKKRPYCCFGLWGIPWGHMKKVLLAIVILLLFVVIIAAWLWRLGAPPTLAASTARLEDLQGQVETRASTTENWVPATNGQVVQSGMQLRTGATGSVTLTVSGVSQTRLSTSTELTVTDLILPQNNDVKSQTSLTLVSGRTWSRIIRLLELDSSYTVTTDDVVATVRGTAFETARFPGQETWIAVYEGQVKAADQMIMHGTGMRAARGAMQMVSSTSAMKPNTDWINQNLEADKTFLKKTQTDLQQELTKEAGLMYEKLGRPAERLRMAMTAENEKAELADKYLGRRLAWAKELQEQGNTAKAEQELNAVQAEMAAWASQAPMTSKEELFPRAMTQGSVLYHDATKDQPTTPFIERDLKNELMQTRPPLENVIESKPVFISPPRTQDAPITKQDQPQPIPTEPAPQPPSDDKAIQEEQARLLIPSKLLLSGSPTTLHLKESALLSAAVLYTNGTRRDVTGQITLVSSDPSVVLVEGMRVIANERPGTVRITANYRENGVSVTESLSFTVQP